MKRTAVVIVVDLSKVSCAQPDLSVVPHSRSPGVHMRVAVVASTTLIAKNRPRVFQQPSEVLPTLDFWLKRTRERCDSIIKSMMGTKNEKVATQLLVRRTGTGTSPQRNANAAILPRHC